MDEEMDEETLRHPLLGRELCFSVPRHFASTQHLVRFRTHKNPRTCDSADTGI